MFNITRYPIIIFSTPRVGSTALTNYIKHQSKKNLIYFSEPDWYGDRALQNCLKIINSTNNYILKIHLQNVSKYQPKTNYILYDPEPYRIRLRRKDVLKQAVSLYIAQTKNQKRNKEIWNAWKKDPGYDILVNEVEPLNYTEEGLITAIKTIHKSTTTINNADINFDLDLYFEDVIPLFKNTDVLEYPKPSNYQEILNTAEQLYSTLDLGCLTGIDPVLPVSQTSVQATTL